MTRLAIVVCLTAIALALASGCTGKNGEKHPSWSDVNTLFGKPAKPPPPAVPLPSTTPSPIKAIVPSPRPHTNWLTWTEIDESNIIYEVWRSTNLPPLPETFTFWTRTNHPPIKLSPLPAYQFFICRSSNTVTRLVSEWNVP